MDILTQLQQYRPKNEQETADLAQMLHLLEQGEDLFSRSNRTCHFTASAWVVSPDRSQVLMAYHDLYRSWAWLGGHADGEKDLLATALREVREESGLTDLHPVSNQIFSLEILAVNGHWKQGNYIPSHLHLNVTYLLEASPSAPLQSRPGENSAVAWFTPKEAVAASSEPWLQTYIYQKLNENIVE